MSSLQEIGLSLLTLLACLVIGGCSTPETDAFDTGFAGRQFPTPPDAEGFRTTRSGLRFKILEPGTHNTTPSIVDTVSVHYRGWFQDGKEFENSYERGEPVSFSLGQVIKGWQEGLQLIGEGGKVELIVPPDLAYGAEGRQGQVPPNATLYYEIELVRVEPALPSSDDAGHLSAAESRPDGLGNPQSKF